MPPLQTPTNRPRVHDPPPPHPHFLPKSRETPKSSLPVLPPNPNPTLPPLPTVAASPCVPPPRHFTSSPTAARTLLGSPAPARPHPHPDAWFRRSPSRLDVVRAAARGALQGIGLSPEGIPQWRRSRRQRRHRGAPRGSRVKGSAIRIDFARPVTPHLPCSPTWISPCIRSPRDSGIQLQLVNPRCFVAMKVYVR
jgi:hypothetical protein